MLSAGGGVVNRYWESNRVRFRPSASYHSLAVTIDATTVSEKRKVGELHLLNTCSVALERGLIR
jgi:hypothetical protein